MRYPHAGMRGCERQFMPRGPGLGGARRTRPSRGRRLRQRRIRPHPWRRSWLSGTTRRPGCRKRLSWPLPERVERGGGPFQLPCASLTALLVSAPDMSLIFFLLAPMAACSGGLGLQSDAIGAREHAGTAQWRGMLIFSWRRACSVRGLALFSRADRVRATVQAKKLCGHRHERTGPGPRVVNAFPVDAVCRLRFSPAKA